MECLSPFWKRLTNPLDNGGNNEQNVRRFKPETILLCSNSANQWGSTALHQSSVFFCDIHLFFVYSWRTGLGYGKPEGKKNWPLYAYTNIPKIDMFIHFEKHSFP